MPQKASERDFTISRICEKMVSMTKTKRKVGKTRKKISVIGLGKLGACYMAFYASKGFSVLGYDINQATLSLLNQGLAPVREPGLADLIRENKEHIAATDDLGRLIDETDLTFMILPTPSRKDGLFSVDYILSVAKAVGAHLKKKDRYHVFVCVSTVLPGNSLDHIIPEFEKHSGKKHGKDFGYAYSPSLIAIGDILRNLEEPDFVFLGAHDERSRDALRSVYEYIYGDTRPIEHMNIESAELAKISLNSYITMKITFANILGEICHRLPHADVDEITTTLGKDKRIGKAYLRSGLGYGGTCFPRDNFAFSAMARKLGIKTPLALITHTLNNEIWKKTLAIILAHSKHHRETIGALGISYKTNTTLHEESQAFFITKALVDQGRNVLIFEPMGHHDARRALGKKVAYAKSYQELVKKSDLVFVSNNDKLFLTIPEILKNTRKKKVIVDPWGMFRHSDFNKHVTYISLGRKYK